MGLGTSIFDREPRPADCIFYGPGQSIALLAQIATRQGFEREFRVSVATSLDFRHLSSPGPNGLIAFLSTFEPLVNENKTFVS